MKEYTGRLVSILYRKSQMYYSRALKDCNITAGEYPLLLALSCQEGITQDKLSLDLSLDKSAVARSLKSLLEKNYVARNRDSDDLRCNRIYLTEEGHRQLPRLLQAVEDWNSILMKDLSKEEQTMLYHLLCHMVENVKGENL